MKIQIEAIHFSADEQLLGFTQQKVSKLKGFFNRINEVRIILKLDKTHKKKISITELKIYLPYGIIYVKESCKTFYGSLGKALVALKLQLIRYKTKRLSYCFT